MLTPENKGFFDSLAEEIRNHTGSEAEALEVLDILSKLVKEKDNTELIKLKESVQGLYIEAYLKRDIVNPSCIYQYGCPDIEAYLKRGIVNKLI